MDKILYDFYCDGGKMGFLMTINAERDEVERLLEEYRKTDEFYSDVGFLEFLVERGYTAEIITCYVSNSSVDIDADEHIAF